MSRYIDADALIAEQRDTLENDVNLYSSHIEKEIRDGKIIYAIERLKDAPTADVEPVRRSNWKRGENFGGEYYECEACGRRARPDLYKFDYCPRCGAKMDGGNTDG